MAQTNWIPGPEMHSDATGKVLSFDESKRTGDGFRAAVRAELEPVRGSVLFVDSAMKGLEQMAARIAPTSVNVLILGETGAGKDVLARTIHERSARADKPFLGLNCASLPQSLLESELFGYERGAFTGAARTKPGLLEAAEGGTLFLDEIGDMPLALQAKLLRLLESREILRLGSIRPRVVDVRFVAATNRDLEGDVSQGRFRQDLYYRLNSVTLRVPPLRERPSEIVPLAQLFLERACASFETGRRQLSPAALSALVSHSWPGNVRELRSVIERAVLLAPGPVIEPKQLDLSSSPVETNPPPEDVDRTNEIDMERNRIAKALHACGGNQSRAAKILGLSRRTLVRRIAQLKLPRPRGKD